MTANTTMSNMSNTSAAANTTSPITFIAQTEEFIIALSVGVGITSILSIIGSATIILTYILFKELRTTSRFLLLNLSIATLLISLSNLVGSISSFKFIGLNKTINSNDHQLCNVEAFIGVYAADCSVLWTVVLLVYLYVSLAFYSPSSKWDKLISVICAIVCWGIPLPIMIVFQVENFFGFVPEYSPGFCTIIINRNVTNDHYSQLYRLIIGYDIFLYISFIVLPILSIIFVCHTRPKMKTFDYSRLQDHISVIKAAERKLLFVPISFMFIKIWSLINGILLFYIPYEISLSYQKSIISAIIVYLTGIGDSAQGLLNAIFFCLLIPAVRFKIILLFYKYCFRHCCSKCSSSTFSDTFENVPTSSNRPTTGSNNCDPEVSTYTISRTNSIVSYDEVYGPKETDSINNGRSRSMTDISSDFYGSQDVDELICKTNTKFP